MVKVGNMAKPNRLLVLFSACTALLFACGLDGRIGVAAAASASTVPAAGRGTCGAGTDQPLCDDPAVADSNKSNEQAKDGGERRNVNASSRDRAVCAAGDDDCAKDASGAPAPRFRSGDVIELYNPSSSDVQIVFPSIVKSRAPGPAGGYSVTKTTDGKEVKDIPEKFLHMYVPYAVGDEALCNIGEFKPARPIIVRCTVLGYEPAASRGALVLQGKYQVKVHATKANEEYETDLPVWKMQRRFLTAA